MSPMRGALVAVVLAAAGCATVDAPVAESESKAPPTVVERPEPTPVPLSPPKSTVSVPTPPPPAPQMARISEAEALITDFERLRRLSGWELIREQDAARQAFNQSRSESARVRLAMVHAIPGGPGYDEARALELLDPLVKSPTAALHGLAFLMASYIQEQRRLAAQVQGLQQNVQGLQQNVQGLQQKLDALRMLERSLSERGESAPGRRR